MTFAAQCPELKYYTVRRRTMVRFLDGGRIPSTDFIIFAGIVAVIGMETKRNFIYFLKNLTVKHRLSYRNQHNDTEVWYMYITPLKIIGGFVALTLLIFVIVVTASVYTPMLELVPGYPGNKARGVMLSNIIRLDSIERELNNLQVYSDNVNRILEGKTPVMRTIVGADTARVSSEQPVVRNKADSMLRAQMEGDGIYGLSTTVTPRDRQAAQSLIAPVQGIISDDFSPKDGRFGVTIAAASAQKVVAVADGTVISAVWIPEQGNVVQIQHADNMVSIYRHMSRQVATKGSRAKAGEVIGYTADGTATDVESGYFEFELWVNGTPVDPHGYIIF